MGKENRKRREGGYHEGGDAREIMVKKKRKRQFLNSQERSKGEKAKTYNLQGSREKDQVDRKKTRWRQRKVGKRHKRQQSI